MQDGEDFLFRPMVKGYCTYKELIDGSLTLFDIAKMNDVIDVQNENEARMMKANQ